VSKHWSQIDSKDQASILSGPPHHAHNNTTTMQYKTKKNTKYIQINADKSTHSEMSPV